MFYFEIRLDSPCRFLCATSCPAHIVLRSLTRFHQSAASGMLLKHAAARLAESQAPSQVATISSRGNSAATMPCSHNQRHQAFTSSQQGGDELTLTMKAFLGFS